MAWWGKLVGGAFGFLLGGPLGAALGAAVGHGFDRGLPPAEPSAGAGSEQPSAQERAQAAFFTATFTVMGHVAKADGRVSPQEITLAREVMRQMALDPTQQRLAQALFHEGKAAGFDLGAALAQLRRECRRGHTLLQMFLEIQLHAVHADGVVDRGESRVLAEIARTLGFSPEQLAHLDAMVRAARRSDGGGQRRTTAGSAALGDAEARAILGVAADADQATIKKAYRRLMSQHHPDRLVARGLPEEMVRAATARTQEIRAAYDRLVAGHADA